MRLHRVRLKNYRGVADCTLEFPTEGVTVIEGDNEVGKTCIPEAVNMILSEFDSSGKKAVKAIRPVHRDEGTEVEVEITSGDYRFTYFKRWHRRPETTLEIAAPSREQLTGREAHERVETILEETLDQDLWKALNIEQGAEPGLPKLNVPSLGQALDQAAGSNLATSSDDALWERICAERLKYWTSTGRESQERKSLIDRIDQSQSKIEDLGTQLHAIEENATEAARLVDDEDSLIIRRDLANEEENVLDERWKATEHLRDHTERMANDFAAAQMQCTKIADDYQRRQEMVEAVRTQSEELASLEAEVSQAAPELEQAMRHNKETAIALKAARRLLRAAESKLRLANDDRDYRRNQIEKDQFLERHERVLAAQERLKAAEIVLDSSQVDGELVDRIEQASLQVTRAKAALEASAATVETTALSALSVLIEGEEVKMSTDTVQRAHVTGDWKLVVPDMVQVSVQAGDESQDLAAEFEAAREEHTRLCTKSGVDNLADARKKADKRREAERTRDESIRAIEENLRDLTLEGLAQKLDGLTKRVASYPANRPKDPPLPSDHDEAKKIASDAENEAAEYQAEVERCEGNAEAASETSKKAEVDSAVQAERLKHARDALRQAEQKLEEARQGLSDHELNEALEDEQRKVQDANAALEQAKKELQNQDPDSLEAKLDNIRNVRAKAISELRNNQDRQRELRGWLEARGDAGLHSQLNEESSMRQLLLREQEGTEARALAAQLLHQTFERRRQEAHQRYVAPFKEKIENLGRIVFGPTFEVDLDNDLRIARRTLEGITLDIDQISVGAREQIGVICRLACAAIVSPDGGGAPVVIDDALGWSDPSRLKAMGAAIGTASRESQVIILTCTPGRYAHVGNATVVRLPR